MRGENQKSVVYLMLYGIKEKKVEFDTLDNMWQPTQIYSRNHWPRKQFLGHLPWLAQTIFQFKSPKFDALSICENTPAPDAARHLSTIGITTPRLHGDKPVVVVFNRHYPAA